MAVVTIALVYRGALAKAVGLEEGAGGVGAVDLEALVLGAVALDETDVVEHGPT